MVSEHEWRLEQLEFLFKNGLCEQPKTTTEFAGIHLYLKIKKQILNI